MRAGQKVVCIDDNFPAWVAPIYSELPVKGRVYVIREVQLGRNYNGEAGEVVLNLIGITGRDSDMEPFPENGFNAERFRPLDETPIVAEEVIENEEVGRVIRVHIPATA